MTYVRHPSRDRGIARDRGKPRDLSLSYVARDHGTHVTLGTHVIKREPFKTRSQVQALILSYLI